MKIHAKNGHLTIIQKVQPRHKLYIPLKQGENIMSRFIQLHLLTSYPPSNLNRDDLGRPKTAMMGGKTRLRISSQSLKRAWRKSNFFFDGGYLEKEMGERTKRFALEWIFEKLQEKNIPENDICTWTRDIQMVFGKPEKEGFINEQLAHISPIEKQGINKVVENIIEYYLNRPKVESYIDEIKKLQNERNEKKKKEEQDKVTNKIIKILQNAVFQSGKTAVDIAFFGRMLTSAPLQNKEAAIQVSHAITVHEVAVEDDFFTAIDDLNKGVEDRGAAHMGETEFAAGVFYIYICINRELLLDLDHLNGDIELANKSIAALLEAAAKISPTGKQNSFASRAYASYILAEKGNQQPRSLSVAYLKSVWGEDILSKAISEIENKRKIMEKVYGSCADEWKTMNAETGEGSLTEIIQFVTE